MFVILNWLASAFIFLATAVICLLVVGLVGALIAIQIYVLIKVPALVVLPIRIQPIWEMLTGDIKFE